MPRSAFALLDATTGRVVESHDPDVLALPGSTVKPFLPAQAVFPCRRTLRIGGQQLDCSHPIALGPLGPADALALSCNCYFAAFALTISPAELQRSLAEFQARLAATDDERRLQALGHWGVIASPLLMARAYRRLLLAGGRPGFTGKTGTTRDAAWYAGWDSLDKPRWVVAVLTGGRGIVDAYPAAREIFHRWSR